VADCEYATEAIVTAATLTDTDVRLRDAVTGQLDWDHRDRFRRCATLTGTAGTWLQRDAAERAAASAPGLARVDNRIVVQSFHDSKTDDWDEMC
jgi:hypothetical protein